MARARFLASVGMLGAALWPPALPASEAPPALPGLRAEARCESLAGPGKVQCTVEERPTAGTLQWGDVIVVAAPSFAPPLRTRLGAGDASRDGPEGADFALALAATGEGRGELRVLARAVVCGVGGCRPVTVEATANVAVGAFADGKTPR